MHSWTILHYLLTSPTMVVGRKVKGPAVQDPSEGADGQKPQVKGALLCHADAKTTPTIDIFGAFWRDQNIYIYTLYIYIYMYIYICVCVYVYIYIYVYPVTPDGLAAIKQNLGTKK